MALEDLFAKAIAVHAKAIAVYGHIIGTAVNVTDHLCDVTIEGEAPLLDVRLNAIEPDEELASFITVKPKENSLVVVGFIEDDKKQALIVQCTEIAEVVVKINSTEFKITTDGYQIKKGADSLKQVIQLLAESQQQIFVLYGNNPNYTKIQQSLSKLNNILI